MMSNVKTGDLKSRTEDYALRIIRMYGQLPKAAVAQVFGRQILRSGTSVGAQYREAARARSRAEFISKIESSLQELDETDYWLKLIERSNLLDSSRMDDIADETNELMAIFVSSAKTAKRNINGGKK